jgi:HK97 family phage major capsid protein
VVSNELLRDSSPSAEQLIRDALVEASSQRIDTTFLSTSAAVAGVSPAGILNGVSALTTLGNDGVGVREDISQLYDPFFTAKNSSGLYLVMYSGLAKKVSLIVNALGQTEFGTLNAAGGTLLGDNVVTGDNVTAGHLILLKPSDIYKIGDMGVEVSISKEATIEQDSAPQGASDTPVAASATLMSMFQTESTAIKIVHPINFAKRRSTAVQYVSNAAYGVATP